MKKQFEAQEIVRKELGPDYKVANVSGFWVIGHESLAGPNGFGRISPNPLRKSLAKAIDDIVQGR